MNVKKMREALTPFTHPDLRKILGGNTEGDASIVFQRDKAVLRIGDFRKAHEALAAYESRTTVEVDRHIFDSIARGECPPDEPGICSMKKSCGDCWRAYLQRREDGDEGHRHIVL